MPAERGGFSLRRRNADAEPRPLPAAASFLRTLVFQTTTGFFDADGVWWSIAAAEIPAFAVSLAFLFGKREKYHYM